MPESQTRLHIVSTPDPTSEPALESLPQWAGVLASSELDQRVVFRRAPPLPALDAALAGSAVRDRDVDRIRHAFEESHGVVLSKQNVVDGYERRRRAARPRGYHYIRRDVPPSQRPSGFEETSWDHEELCPSTQGDRS